MSILAAQVPSLLARLGHPEVLALGEPNHVEPAFPALRNDLLAVLVEHGYRSVALESDRVRGLAVDDWVRGGAGGLDDVLATGFSHGWGAHPANRELLGWMRAWNAAHPPADHVRFHGVDAPIEYGPPPSPRPYLEHLHAYLAAHVEPLPHDARHLAGLLGADDRWTEPEAFHDATRSVGATPQAGALRAVADDLLVALHAHAPALVAASSPESWYRAEVYGRAALGLLRYHARAARPDAPAVRISGMLAVRDVLIAENLLAVHAHERRRGPVLVFANNGHLQRHPVVWRQPDLELEWAVAGGLVARQLGEDYAFVAGSLGASAAVGLAAPATGTIEGALPVVQGELVDPRPFHGAGLVERTDVTPEQGHFPLTPALLADAAALLHVASSPAGPTADELAERIRALPGVTVLVADEAGGAPEVSWGDRFFFVGDDRRRPFATIVSRDVPGFDEASRLDRPGAYRLNVELGRRGFEAEFGFPPAELPDRLPGIDAARLDTVVPHPAYGTHGWASVLNPGPASLPEADRLLAAALARRSRARA